MLFKILILTAAYLYPHITSMTNYLQKIEGELHPSGMECVDCIYVINLEKRPEKWSRTKANFEEQGLTPNRFNAVNGRTFPYWKRAAITGPYLINWPVGQYGALLSHISIYKDAFERNFKITWVCEDDIKFANSANVLPSLLQELSEIDPDWDLLYTDHYTKGMGVQDRRPGQSPYEPEYVQVSPNFYKMLGRYGQHSILFSRKGIEKVWEYFSHVFLYSPIDIDIHYVPGLRSYMTSSHFVTVVDDLTISDTGEVWKESK